MSDDAPKIFPLGESAVVVEFAREISEQANDRTIAFADHLNSHPFKGLIEAVPAYSSATVHFDLSAVTTAFPEFTVAFDAVCYFVGPSLSLAVGQTKQTRNIVEIPATFSNVSGLDLENVAATCEMSVDEVIRCFTKITYRVFMIGFLPGFAYMGEVDEQIRVPRRSQPRTRVPQGSVAIAGPQCGVYPFETPGGWNVIGHTDVEFFLPHADRPSLLQAGDLVRFVAV
jgi:inhibitor of KinA